MNWVEVLREMNSDAVLFDDYDSAIVGIVHMDMHLFNNADVLPRVVALYAYEKLIAITANSMKENNTYEGMEDVMTAAIEYVDYNICGFWYGPNTPVIMSMENRYAVREQGKTLQEGIRATEGEAGTSSPDGAPESP